MSEANPVKSLYESIAFFENEVEEFTKAKKADEEAQAMSTSRAEWRDYALAIKFNQEFIDESQKSLDEYRARLKEIQK